MSDRYQKSRRLLARAERTLAGGVSSNVRRGDQPLPLYFEHGLGSRVFDVDGNEYIDYVLGRGPLFLGHTHPEINEATIRQLRRGQIYAAQHELEIELAERLAKLIPSAEQVRFGISGSEAVHAALRVARAFTGRALVVKFEGHYHGWLDNIFYSLSPPPEEWGGEMRPVARSESAGQPSGQESRIAVLPWNHADALERFLEAHGAETAAIITEPIMCNTAVIMPRPGYLERLREACTRYGIVLIFDEVITGFRVALSGAQGYFGIEPDLSIFGKAIANGMPLSCLAGRADILRLIADGRVVHGGTYNSLPVSIAAAVATIDVLARDGGAIYREVEANGSTLMRGIRERAAKLGVPVVVQGHPSVFFVGFPAPGTPAEIEVSDYRSSLSMDHAVYNQFAAALAGEGVRVIPRGNWFLSSAHTRSDISRTLDAVEVALAEAVVPHYAVAQPSHSIIG
ncbi:MAG: aspartate aminotransferase family protein [Terriglobia bacterium]